MNPAQLVEHRLAVMVAGRLVAWSQSRRSRPQNAVGVPASGRIVDEGAGRYAAVLRDAGCTDVAVRQLDWRTWYGIPGHHFPLVAAARPSY